MLWPVLRLTDPKLHWRLQSTLQPFEICFVSDLSFARQMCSCIALTRLKPVYPTMFRGLPVLMMVLIRNNGVNENIKFIRSRSKYWYWMWHGILWVQPSVQATLTSKCAGEVKPNALHLLPQHCYLIVCSVFWSWQSLGRYKNATPRRDMLLDVSAALHQCTLLLSIHRAWMKV